ncbi:MAG: ETC complex I subunit [Rickettsiales bacterium]|nr:ETC complex I subunit [Rickettsiales bacterium]
MTQFVIYQPAKSSMQSGRRNCQKWLLSPTESIKHRTINPLMGWFSSSNTIYQLKLVFSSKEQAVAYATKKSLNFKIIESKEVKIQPKSYSNNFTG